MFNPSNVILITLPFATKIGESRLGRALGQPTGAPPAAANLCGGLAIISYLLPFVMTYRHLKNLYKKCNIQQEVKYVKIF